MLAFVFLISGCAEDPKEAASYGINEELYSMAEDLYGFTAALNGDVLSFPLKYSDLVKAGWKIKSTHNTGYITSIRVEIN